MKASSRSTKPTTLTERTLQARRRVRRRGIALVFVGLLLGGGLAAARAHPPAAPPALVTPDLPRGGASSTPLLMEPPAYPPRPWSGVIVSPKRGLVRFAVPVVAGAPRVGDRVEVVSAGEIAVAVAKVTVVGEAPGPLPARFVVEAVVVAGAGGRSLGGAGRAVRVRPLDDPRRNDEASGRPRERREAPALAALRRH